MDETTHQIVGEKTQGRRRNDPCNGERGRGGGETIRGRNDSGRNFIQYLTWVFDRPEKILTIPFINLSTIHFFMWLCGLYYGTLHVLKSSRALCPRVWSFILALWSPRLGKREMVCVFLVHLFVCLVRASFCNFSLPLGVRGGRRLRFVMVALPGLFC